MVRSEHSDQAFDLNVEPESSVPCSICLDLVTYGGERSRAKLKCGHEFHLDCIGSAFNMKGMMQCPNCRTVEKGRWLYSSGSTNSTPELGMDDWSVDNYPFYIAFPEMPYRVQICPFRGFTQVHPSSQQEKKKKAVTFPWNHDWFGTPTALERKTEDEVECWSNEHINPDGCPSTSKCKQSSSASSSSSSRVGPISTCLISTSTASSSRNTDAH